MRKAKKSLYLVTDKKVLRKYDTFTIYLVDGIVVEYKLDEYEVAMIDNDWVEVSKIDETVMDWFAMHNILRARFTSSKVKAIPNEKRVPELSPVA